MWQTRTLAIAVAATVPVETKGEVSPVMEWAQSIGDPTVAVETDEKSTQVDPSPGTYEAFMGSFGAPSRWAGGR